MAVVSPPAENGAPLLTRSDDGSVTIKIMAVLSASRKWRASLLAARPDWQLIQLRHTKVLTLVSRVIKTNGAVVSRHPTGGGSEASPSGSAIFAELQGSFATNRPMV